jgi:DNA-binding NarL/FixJ family response regulator
MTIQQLIIADNQDISKAGLFFFTERYKLYEKMEEAADKKELIHLLGRVESSVVVLDYTLSDFSSADELLILQERFPKTRWILFSESLSNDFLHRIVFSSHAFSIVQKDCGEDEILSALKYASRNERYICNRVSNQLLTARNEPVKKQERILTQTETEILKEIAKGKTTKEIAVDRNLSFHTVTSHRKNIFRKLDVNNVHEATKYAVRAGIVDMMEYYI